MEISKEQYPYEMYCATCGTLGAYMDHMPDYGSIIKAKGAINLDGTEPKAGDPMPRCKCYGTNYPTKWCVRART